MSRLILGRPCGPTCGQMQRGGGGLNFSAYFNQKPGCPKPVVLSLVNDEYTDDFPGSGGFRPVNSPGVTRWPQTIANPFSGMCEVQITGYVDDAVAINGVEESAAAPWTWFGTTFPAVTRGLGATGYLTSNHSPIGYSFKIGPGVSFVIEDVNNYDPRAQWNLTIVLAPI